MEGDVALYLLHDLMDVAVQDRDRAEALEVGERLGGVVGAPAPRRIDAPEGDVGEDDDRLRGRAAPEVVLEPFELLRAEAAEPAGLEVDDIDQAHEVDARGIEAVPAGSLGAAAEPGPVGGAFVDQHVVLAGDVVDVEPGALDQRLRRVELGLLREVADVAGVQHEGRLWPQGLDSLDGQAERAGDVGVGGLVEADMAVADLDEAEPARGRLGRLGGADQPRARHAAGDRPEHARPDPGHAAQQAAPVDDFVTHLRLLEVG